MVESVAIVVLDGWGIADPGPGNAVTSAETPTFDELWASCPSTTLQADGRSVGLPEGQMGNSEVGHLTIGAGRAVKQAYARIEDAISRGDLVDRRAIDGAFDHAASTGRRVHLLGLVSDGGVHGDHEHVHTLIRAANRRGVDAVTHAFTDGRDTPPTSGKRFLSELKSVADEENNGAVATVSGRYYAMDRDENWERTRMAYEAIVNRDAPREAPDCVTALEAAYGRGQTDEFIEPTIIDERSAVTDGDAVIFCNFRADRARQLTRMIANIDPVWSPPTHPPDAHVVTMTEYHRTFDLPVAFPPRQPKNTLGEIVADAGYRQLRLAESEKYAHVTYFLNGGREIEFPGEIRTIIPSPDVATYDERPEMSASSVTDAAIETMATDAPELLVMNYANPDMVGHTGDFDAAVVACEAVDRELDRLLDALDGHVIITADHGNAEQMGSPDDPHTAHTFNRVPCIYRPQEWEDDLHLSEGSLADIAPTALSLLGLEQPPEMTGTRLIIDG
ncbi:MAG: 2,3-bisphosphoglycerate-independent phosphoglycerate mutase [Halobacteriaceae archaeon]